MKERLKKLKKLEERRKHKKPKPEQRLKQKLKQQEKIKMVEALERLEKNKDFQKVILDGYMRDEVLRANSLLANHTIKAQGKRTDIIEMLVAVSTFGEYLETIRALGASARYQKANPVSTEE